MFEKGNYFLSVKKKNLFLEVFLFLVIVIVLILTFQVQKNKLVATEICNLIKNNYLDKIDNKKYNQCLNLNSKFQFDDSAKINKFNKWLNHFQISHFYIYNSKENKKMWQGEGLETGVIAKRIFDKWRVVQILTQNNPIKIGDQILAINGRQVKSAQQILSTEGRFKILRKKQVLKLEVTFSDVIYDDRLIAKKIDSNWSYLKIPSFKSEFFGYDELARIFEHLNSKSLVIDVRDNLGGNFVAMLRVVSMLECEDKGVGAIFHNRTDFSGKEFLKDDLSDYEQILQVNGSNPVYLKLFKTELCIKPNKLVLLMNEHTASVSELFVQILKNQFKDLKVLGTTSAGQMVLSIWYPIKYLGSGVMMSVPYAWATASDKEILEGFGVSPTLDLTFKNLEKYKDSLDPLLEYVWESEKVKHSLSQDDISKSPASEAFKLETLNSEKNINKNQSLKSSFGG